MNEKRYAAKVGLFVFLGIVLIAVLMVNFSRGVGMFKPKYQLTMKVRSVAGLKPRSAVLLSGVQIGNVKGVQLDRKNNLALVHLSILEEFPLQKDSRFVIQQQGVLGDQFVIIYPGTPGSELVQDGDVVEGGEPFDLQEVAKSTSDLLKRFDQLGATVAAAIDRVNKQVLDAQTLSNLSQTIANFEGVSEKTSALIDNAAVVVSNSGPALTLAFTNLLTFSSQLNKLAMDLDETLNTNRAELNESMKNLRDATVSMKQMTAEAQNGKGLVGGLLKDEALRMQLTSTVSNLSVLSSNLNRYGLLYKPKQPKNQTPPAYPGKSPFR
jgi:phospholipid/cholesterol/gamma-HCH transport system substrate-binding protein